MTKAQTTSEEVLELVSPYFSAFKEGCRIFSFSGASSGDRLLFGEHVDYGQGIFRSYARTAIPVPLTFRETCDLFGDCASTLNEDVISKDVLSVLEGHGYYEVPSVSFSKFIGVVEEKLDHILECVMED